MKKILLGTTAVVALGTLSTEAFAADKIKLELGGFMRQYVGFSDSDEVAATSNVIAGRDTGLGQTANTEVYFTGSTTLDNGLKVAATIQLEGNTSQTGRHIDESYVTVSSDAMGALSLGSRPHAAASLDVRAPMVSNNDWDDVRKWGGSATTGTGTTGTAAFVANDMDADWTDDTIKAVYMSPSFAGVSFGASWAAGANLNTDSVPLVTNGNTDTYSFAVAYAGDFDGVSVDASLVHGRTTNTHDKTGVGLSVGVAGFTIGGDYYDFDGNTANSTGSALTTSADGKGWELGIGYETGPYTLTGTYMNSEDKGTTGTAGDDEDTAWMLSAAYDLGAGVALTATYYDMENDAEGTTAAVNTKGLITGIEVGF